jgi:methylglyoxal reductase
MKYLPLGDSGLSSSVIGFGAWAIGGGAVWGGASDDDQSIHHPRRARRRHQPARHRARLRLGPQRAAHCESHRRPPRRRVILATKCGLWWDDPRILLHRVQRQEHLPLAPPDTIAIEVERSLTDLATDRIDLYQVHWPAVEPEKTPIEDTMAALLKLKDQGKIRAIGVCNLSPGELETYLSCGAIATHQFRYSMLAREPEKEILPLCQKHHLATLTYMSLEQGLLTGKIGMDHVFRTVSSAPAPIGSRGCCRRTAGACSICWMAGNHSAKPTTARSPSSSLPGRSPNPASPTCSPAPANSTTSGDRRRSGHRTACGRPRSHHRRPRFPWATRDMKPIPSFAVFLLLASTSVRAEPVPVPDFRLMVAESINRECHEQTREEGAPGLRGDVFAEHGHSEAYRSLIPFAWAKSGGNHIGITRNKTSYSIPGDVGARASNSGSSSTKATTTSNSTPGTSAASPFGSTPTACSTATTSTPKPKPKANAPNHALNDKPTPAPMNPHLVLPFLTAALLAFPPIHAETGAVRNAPPVRMVRQLTLADAQRIAEAAQSHAAGNGWNVVITVVDGGGHLLVLRRMDGTQTGSIDIAIRKAESAFHFKRPTKDLQDLIARDGLTFVMTLPNVTAVEGGLPVIHNGEVIGAIGVSGVTAEQDGMIAAAAVAAFQ